MIENTVQIEVSKATLKNWQENVNILTKIIGILLNIILFGIPKPILATAFVLSAWKNFIQNLVKAPN